VCGIIGCVGSRDVPKVTVSVLDGISHRGPDAQGSRHATGSNGSWSIGSTRLAINDLSSAGDQPLASEDETLLLVFNGEIYNYFELRAFCESHGHRFRSDSDGEVIIHLYEIEGAASFSRLNGIYAFALADATSGDLVLARDPLGVKPLFYVDEGERLWFASEIAALAGAGAKVGGFDAVALAQFLTFLWVPDPRTPFQGCKALPPGHLLRWSEGRVETVRFMDLLTEEGAELPTASPAVVEEGFSLLQRAVSRQLLSDVPIGILVSGGIDSSLLWSEAHEQLTTAYTIDWSGGQDVSQYTKDTQAVILLEQEFKAKVEYINPTGCTGAELPPSGDLFADPAYQLTSIIAERAAELGQKVLLSGHGGDEVFGGYRRHIITPVLRSMRASHIARPLTNMVGKMRFRPFTSEYLHRMVRAVNEKDDFSAYMQLCTYSTARDRARVLGCTEAEVSNEVVWGQHRDVYDRLPGEWTMLRRVRALDLAVYLSGLGLAYTDRASMRHGVEIRVPWLDIELVRWAMRLPDDALVRGRRGKLLPRAWATHVLPAAIASMPKRSFGVPDDLVSDAPGEAGELGHRQGSYFERASSQLGVYLNA
jgi:asparagine synthase (glutamine-hydrolysing)